MIFDNDRAGMTPDELLRAARRTEELAAELDHFDPDLLAPRNPAVVGHERLARALTDAEGAWRSTLRVLRADLCRVAELLRATATTTARNDQHVAEDLRQVDSGHHWISRDRLR